MEIHGGRGRREIAEKVDEVMAEVGLSPAARERLPIGMSAGQRQRVNIARALVLEPELLILDETLSALDPMEQARLLDLFERLQARHGFTYLFISHDLAMVRRVCTRIAVMYLGKVVELADTQKRLLRSRPSLHAGLALGRADAGGEALPDRGLPARGRAAEPDRLADGLQLRRPLPARHADLPHRAAD